MSQEDLTIDMDNESNLSVEESSTSTEPDQTTEAVVDTKPATKTSTVKKGTRGRKSVKKEGDAKSPVVLVKPIEMQKKFTPNTVVNYCNSYFSNTYEYSVSFNKYNDEKESKKVAGKSKQVIMDLTAIPAVERIRKVVESIDIENLKTKAAEYRSFDKAESEELARLIHAPYFHTVLCYASEKKLTSERFVSLCREFDINPVKQIGIAKTISDLAAFASNENRIIPRAFNSVFGEHYQTLHPEKKEVHKRYLQHAPEMIRDILTTKDEDFTISNTKLMSKFLTIYARKFTKAQKDLNKSLGENSIEKCLQKRDSNIFKDKSVDDIKKEYATDAATADIEVLYSTYQKMNAIANFIDYLSEIKDAEFYHKHLMEINRICDEFTAAAEELESLSSTAATFETDEEQWPYLLKALVILTRVYTNFSNEKKKPSTILLTHLRKAKINVNIKSDKLKKKIESLADNEVTDIKTIAEVAEENKSALAQLSISKSYDPTQTDIYEKIGNYIYNRWNSRKDIPRINKNVRIAIGMTLFMYIQEQVKILTVGRKQTNIAMKF